MFAHKTRDDLCEAYGAHGLSVRQPARGQCAYRNDETGLSSVDVAGGAEIKSPAKSSSPGL